MIAHCFLAVGLLWAALDIGDDVADWWIAWGLLITTGLLILGWEWLIRRWSADAVQAARCAAIDQELRARASSLEDGRR